MSINKNNKLEIYDDLSDLGEHVLDEEITILTPYLAEKVLEVVEGTQVDDEDESSIICPGEHGKAG